MTLDNRQIALDLEVLRVVSILCYNNMRSVREKVNGAYARKIDKVLYALTDITCEIVGKDASGKKSCKKSR